jgi:hypothetical protein
VLERRDAAPIRIGALGFGIAAEVLERVVPRLAG